MRQNQNDRVPVRHLHPRPGARVRPRNAWLVCSKRSCFNGCCGFCVLLFYTSFFLAKSGGMRCSCVVLSHLLSDELHFL